MSDASGNATWQGVSGGGWGFIGNTGTNPLTNFIGTTDAKDLVFKTNNTEQLRITSSGNLVGIGGMTGTYTNSIAL